MTNQEWVLTTRLEAALRECSFQRHRAAFFEAALYQISVVGTGIEGVMARRTLEYAPKGDEHDTPQAD